MDLWSAIFTVVRRWYISVPVLVVAIVAMVVIGGRMKPDYQSKASVVFNPPARTVINGQEQSFKNQWASDPKTLAAAVYRQLKSTDEQKRLKDQGFSTKYDIMLDQFSALMDITATGKSQDDAINTAAQLIKEAEQTAKNIQKQSQPPANEYVTVNTVSQPVDAELVPGSKPRVMATILLLGLVGAASAAFMAESLVTRRRQLRAGGGAPPVPASSPPPYPYPTYPALPPGGYATPGGYAAPGGPLPPGYGYVPVMPMSAPHEAVDGSSSATVVAQNSAASPTREMADADPLDALLDQVTAAEHGQQASGQARGVGAEARVINRGRTAGRDEQASDPGTGRPGATPPEDDSIPVDGGELAEESELWDEAQLVDAAQVTQEAEFVEEVLAADDPSAQETATTAASTVDGEAESEAESDTGTEHEAEAEAEADTGTEPEAEAEAEAESDTGTGPEAEAAHSLEPDEEVHVEPEAVDDLTVDPANGTDETADDVVPLGPPTMAAATSAPAPADEEIASSAAADATDDAPRDQAKAANATPGTRRDGDGNRGRSGRNNAGRGAADRKAVTRNGGKGGSLGRKSRRSLFSSPDDSPPASELADDEAISPVTSEAPTPHGD